ncbi:MAG: GGDEF domain-containing protein, partial [Gammaproteobacteria bacterium]
GKIARIQIVLGFLVPFLIGYLLLLISTRHADEFLGLFVILISIFVSAMVAYSAAFQEKVDYDRRKAERELKSAAMRDPLTSLYNRGFFFHSGVLLLQRAVRNRENLTALMIDIDHFKNINDNFGHQAGDVVLRRVAQAIAETVRKQDLAGRYGGEEFAVLLPDTDMIGARRLAEKLRHNVSELCFPSVGRVTISVGCALWHESDNLTSLLEAADKHLYVAKATGRNRVAG